MIAPPQIPPTHALVICVLVGVAVLYGVICFLQALRTPPDAWTEINKIGGFPKRGE